MKLNKFLLSCAILSYATSAYSNGYGWHKSNSFDLSTDQMRMYDNPPLDQKTKVLEKKIISVKKPIVQKKSIEPKIVKPINVQVAKTTTDVYYEDKSKEVINILKEKTSMDEYYEASTNHLYQVRNELLVQWNNPTIRAAVQARIEIEVGSQGEKAQQAFLECISNRSVSRYDGDLVKAVNNHDGYYPQKDNSRWKNLSGQIDDTLEEKYKNIGHKVFKEASNISKYATGNASGSVGFGGGPQTLHTGGEKFGIESADIGWAKVYLVKGEKNN